MLLSFADTLISISSFIEKHVKDMSTMKVITTATMVERFGVNGALARKLMKYACEQKVVTCVDSQLPIYTRNRGGEESDEEES